jgi:hypothetical protein
VRRSTSASDHLARKGDHERDGADGWFFGVWQPEHVRDPTSGIEYAFTDAPDELLASDPGCWTLEDRCAVARVRRAA